MKRFNNRLDLLLATVLIAILTGLGGILLHYLLEVAEHLAFGHGEGKVHFLTDGTSGFRRFAVLLIVGVLSAFVWYGLQKSRPILSIKGQMTSKSLFLKSPNHFFRQLAHIFWQIISVGGGSPIGKEGAPRELGALLASPITYALNLSIKDRSFLIACGAGAGLAAVYQVPLTSAFFVFETLKVKVRPRNILLVTLATYLSAYTARLVISAKPLYQVSGLSWRVQDFPWMMLLVVLLSPLAFIFSHLTTWVSQRRIRDKRLLVSLPLAFLVLGYLAFQWPHLLGNGRMMAQEVLNGTTIDNATVLLLFKAFIVLLVLWAGAYGGTLTPSFALGLAAAFLVQNGLFAIGVEVTGSSFLLIGAVTFLTITLKAPLSAVGLVYGFTGLTTEALPYLLVLAGFAFFNRKAMEKGLG